jgi:hypothetical protein
MPSPTATGTLESAHVDDDHLVSATGLSQRNTVEVCPTTPLADMMANLEDFPTAFQ